MATARTRNWLRPMILVAAVAAALVLTALGVLALFADRWVAGFVDDQVAQLRQQLDRPVEVGDVDVSVFGGHLRVEDVQLGAAANEPDDAPALQLQVARVDVGLLRSLLSLGRRPHIESVEVGGLRAHVVKRPDGTLNWQEISARLQPEEPEPAPEEPPRALRNARLDRLLLEEGQVALVEMGQGGATRRASISQIEMLLEDVSWDEGLTLALDAAVIQDERNLRVRGRLGGVEEDQLLPDIPALDLQMQPTQLAPLAPFLAAVADDVPQQGILSADVRVQAEAGEQGTAAGEVSLEDGRFPEGEPFDAYTRFDLRVDSEAGDVAIEEMVAAAGTMRVTAQGRLADLDDAPRIAGLDVQSRGLSFDRIRAMYPPFDGLVEPLALRGPFAIRATGSGDEARQTAEIEVRLSEAAIALEDRFAKPPGTPLVLRARLASDGSVVDVERASLELAGWQLLGQGQARYEDGEVAQFRMELSTPEPSAGGLVRLLPPVARAVPEGRALGGEIAVSATAEGTPDDLEAQGALRIANLNVTAPQTRLRGGGQARFELSKQGARTTGQATADFAGLQAVYQDVIQKRANTPLNLDAEWRGDDEGTQLQADAQLATLSARGRAQLRPMEEEEVAAGESPPQRFTATVEVPSFAVQPVLALLPASSRPNLGRDMRVGGQLEARGVTGQPEALEVEVPRFTASAGRSRVSGQGTLRNAAEPQIALQARAPYLDTSDFVPDTGDGAAGRRADGARGGRTAAARDEAARAGEPSLLARTDGEIDLQVQEGRAGGVAFSNLQAQLRLQDGRARAEQLEVDTFGGHFSGSGSELPLLADRGPYQLTGSVRSLQVAPLLARFAGAEQLLTGGLSAAFDLTAADTTPAALAQTLSGNLRGSVDQAEFLPASGFAALVDRLGALARVPGLAKTLDQVGQQESTWQLENLSGALRFDDGTMLLAEPLTADTPHGQVRFEGRLDLGGSGDLRGTLALRPEAIDALIGTDTGLDQPIPVSFRMQGPLTQPRFAFEDLTPILQPLVTSYLRSQAGRQIEKGVGQEIWERLGKQPGDDEAQEQPQPDAKEEPEPQRPEEQIRERLRGLF